MACNSTSVRVDPLRQFSSHPNPHPYHRPATPTRPHTPSHNDKVMPLPPLPSNSVPPLPLFDPSPSPSSPPSVGGRKAGIPGITGGGHQIDRVEPMRGGLHTTQVVPNPQISHLLKTVSCMDASSTLSFPFSSLCSSSSSALPSSSSSPSSSASSAATRLIPPPPSSLAKSSLPLSSTHSAPLPLPTPLNFLDLLNIAHTHYQDGLYKETLEICEQMYLYDAYRVENLLLLGATHFQLHHYSESIFYNQQCIRINPIFAEAYGNLGNALKELGDVETAIQYYSTAIKLKPRFGDAYNNLASTYIQIGQYQHAIETYHMALICNPASVEVYCNLGYLYKIQGFLHEAKVCFEKTLEIQPNYAIAWSHLASLYKETSQYELAIQHYLCAIQYSPTFVQAYSNLGNVYKEMGHLQEAIDIYQKAIQLKPDFAIAHGNLASCYYDIGQLEAAIHTFRYAISLEANFPDAYNNLGNAIRELAHTHHVSVPSSSPSSRRNIDNKKDQHEKEEKDKQAKEDLYMKGINEAIECYQHCLQLKADHPHAYNNLGNALKDKGRIQEAIHCYTTATKLMPNFAAAYSNLGSILKEQGNLEQALIHYQEAILIDASFADAYSNMGNVYKDLNRLEESIQCYTTAIRLKPNFPDAYSNLASAYKDNGKINDAITCYRKALSLKPDFPDAYANYVHSLVFICDWSEREENFKQLEYFLKRQLDRNNILPSVQPFHALVYPFSMKTFQEIAVKYAQRAQLNIALHESSVFPGSNSTSKLNSERHGEAKNLARRRAFPHLSLTLNPSERLRVGYVSSDFGNHPLSHLMQSVFGMHDRLKYEVFCYAISPNNDSIYRSKISSEVEHFIDLSPYTNVDALKLITSHRIQILINLNGYTKGARNELFALRPAPLQLSYMGFCGTLGADYIDYMVGDRVIVPPRLQEYYTEKMLYMPHCYFVTDHLQSARNVLDLSQCPTRQQYGIPENDFVFCNFNQVYKIDPLTFTHWMNILRRVPHSILWLLRFPPLAEQNIKKEAQKQGIDIQRIFFTDVAPKEEHLKRGYLADLFLDTPECNGHTTGCDILWGGTPMLTCAKDRMSTRVATSLLHAIDLPELSVSSLQEYENLAVTLATDMHQLFNIRKKLEENRLTCALFDTKRWVKNLETGFDLIWNKYENGEEPDHVYIQDIYEQEGNDANAKEVVGGDREEQRDERAGRRGHSKAQVQETAIAAS